MIDQIIDPVSESTYKEIWMATAKMWDVMSNDEAEELKRRSSAKSLLVESAMVLWRRKRRSITMDDISALCLFFNVS
ncbi:hypothetical protein AALP_AA7G195500 [Arabis alpina]|uniref:Uncharacterized protein n=1 Tax=Arabis alpina TaxID=50452 RepID=A0A087GJ67_ARAAL|nr:hypothetical protein AALP_AA7G195500 [Arabis alpina]